MDIRSSYDPQSWELTVIVDGKEYIYTGMSPFHNDTFTTKARRNKGKAMAYLRGFHLKGDDKKSTPE